MQGMIVFCFLCVLVAVSAFSPLRSTSCYSMSRIQQRVGQLQMSEPPKEGEWMGAKKFSMNNRYTQTVLSSEQISKILPHRYPILLVDRVIEMVPGKKIVGIKCITANEPQFTGHFPDRPIMPGVLMIEAMAQLGGILCLQPPISTGEGQKIFFFTGVNGVRWKTPVTPGDQLIMEMELLNFDERLGFATLTGKAYVGGKIAVSVEEFTFALAR